MWLFVRWTTLSLNLGVRDTTLKILEVDSALYGWWERGLTRSLSLIGDFEELDVLSSWG